MLVLKYLGVVLKCPRFTKDDQRKMTLVLFNFSLTSLFWLLNKQFVLNVSRLYDTVLDGHVSLCWDDAYHCILCSMISFCVAPSFVHKRGVSCEVTSCSLCHLLHHGVCDRGQEEPVHAVEAGGDSPQRGISSKIPWEQISISSSPVQILSVLHFIFSSPLGNKVVLL